VPQPAIQQSRYNPPMLIHFVGAGSRSPSLTLDQSKGILQYCLAEGATLFTVNFLYVKREESEKLMESFYQRLSPFSAGTRPLESIGGNRFQQLACWIFNDASIDLILNEVDGDLFAYDVTNLPEDWVFYVGESIFLQTVTHEQEAILRISERQYARFKRLGIPHGLGCPQWSGLSEESPRTPLR
jgi:hypothetical protein